ncbi:unnamed protein product [Effrenium voratum]|nr:unnamed protein product [Effrenium voratum]
MGALGAWQFLESLEACTCQAKDTFFATTRSGGQVWGLAPGLGQAKQPAWTRNARGPESGAGYDFVLPIGYERPWERRGQPETASLEADPDPYILQTYDARLGNALLLVTHNLFFGDRQSLLSPNYGGAAYRTLRNLVVPLPFTLNCAFGSGLNWGAAMPRAKASSAWVKVQAPPGGRAWQSERGRLSSVPFLVSFAGSQNGETRRLLHKGAETLRSRLSDADKKKLAVRFVVEDEARARLSQDPSSVLAGWFGDSVQSFDDLLKKSRFCLVLPGDVSDLAMRFFHALSAGCTPVVVGGPSATVPLPFAEFLDYSRFAKFARVRNAHTSVTFSENSSLRRLEKSPLMQPLELSRLCSFTLGSLILTAKPRPELAIKREEIRLKEALLAIDWIGGPPEDPAAVVLVFPGIGTNARSGFAGSSAHHLANVFPHFAVGVAVLQGHDGLPLHSTCLPATAYVSMGDTGRIIEHSSAKYPKKPHFVLACSIGAAHFTHWAGTHPEKVRGCRLAGAVLCCHGFASRPAASAVDTSGAAGFILAAYRDILKGCQREIPGLDLEKVLAARRHCRNGTRRYFQSMASRQGCLGRCGHHA